ncbi:MAG: hypothetical protein J1F35_06295 [Erysipelotrichales bacterium]|nr:hypothetical protein [Erysipelotrichales bacterium]
MKSLSEYIKEAQNYDEPPQGVKIIGFNNNNAKQTYHKRYADKTWETPINITEDVINVFKPLKWSGEKCFEQWAKCIDPEHVGDYDFYDNIDGADIDGFSNSISYKELKENKKWTLIPYWYENESNLCLLGLDVRSRKAFNLVIPDNNIVDKEKIKKTFGFENKKFLLAISENFSGWTHVTEPNLDNIYSAVCFAMKSDLK